MKGLKRAFMNEPKIFRKISNPTSELLDPVSLVSRCTQQVASVGRRNVNSNRSRAASPARHARAVPLHQLPFKSYTRSYCTLPRACAHACAFRDVLTAGARERERVKTRKFRRVKYHGWDCKMHACSP